jgi:hypothetical protein
MYNLIVNGINLSGTASILSSARERIYSRRIFFVHVPKCGGTSLSHALRLRYLFSHFRLREEASAAAGQDLTGAEWMAFKRMLVAYHAELGCHYLQGHVSVDSAFLDRYLRKYIFITILREPVSRIVSHYFFDPVLREMSLDEFLKSRRCEIECNVFCHFFGELPWEGGGDRNLAVARGIGNLERFTAVGLVEDMDSLRQRLRKTTGHNISIPKRNIGENKWEKDLPETFLEEIRERSAADRRIYRHFLDRTSRQEGALLAASTAS